MRQTARGMADAGVPAYQLCTGEGETGSEVKIIFGYITSWASLGYLRPCLKISQKPHPKGKEQQTEVVLKASHGAADIIRAGNWNVPLKTRQGPKARAGNESQCARLRYSCAKALQTEPGCFPSLL